MTDWINGVCDEVDRIAAQDTYYQELDAQRRALEPAHLNILHSLPTADREIITDYEYLLSELAYQKTQVAYRVGCRRC